MCIYLRLILRRKDVCIHVSIVTRLVYMSYPVSIVSFVLWLTAIPGPQRTWSSKLILPLDSPTCGEERACALHPQEYRIAGIYFEGINVRGFRRLSLYRKNLYPRKFINSRRVQYYWPHLSTIEVPHRYRLGLDSRLTVWRYSCMLMCACAKRLELRPRK